MTNKVFTACDNTRLMCAIWDNVQNPIGVVQIIHGIFDTMQTYDKLAHFLNRNGYIVFGVDKSLSRGACNFNDTVKHEIDILRHLTQKYMLPIFLIGYGYGGFIAQSIMQYADTPTSAVCLIKSGRHYRWAIKLARIFARVCARIYGHNAPARTINFFIRKHCGHVQKSPMGTYGFYVSVLDGLAQLNANDKFEHPVLIICNADDCDTLNPRFSRALYDAYRDNDLVNTTLMIYPDMQNRLLLEINCGQVQGDILSFFNDTNLKLHSVTKQNI